MHANLGDFAAQFLLEAVISVLQDDLFLAFALVDVRRYRRHQTCSYHQVVPIRMTSVGALLNRDISSRYLLL